MFVAKLNQKNTCKTYLNYSYFPDYYILILENIFCHRKHFFRVKKRINPIESIETVFYIGIPVLGTPLFWSYQKIATKK